MGLISKNVRATLYKRCKGKCPECGRNMSLTNPRAVNSYMTVDHIVPKSMGGTNNIGSLRPLCRECNIRRGSNVEGVSSYINDTGHYVSKIYNISKKHN